MKRKIKFIALALLLISSSAGAADLDYAYKNSVSIQFGLNGVMSDFNSFGLQFIPPDLSYAREIYENQNFDISTATFYDNIGVKIDGTNFSYRVGQRIDFALKTGIYEPYITIGFGIMRYGHHRQTSPVYGTGFLRKISKRFVWVNEINFQNVVMNHIHETIANLSTGVVYNF